MPLGILVLVTGMAVLVAQGVRLPILLIDWIHLPTWVGLAVGMVLLAWCLDEP